MLAFYLNYFESETKAGKRKKNFYVWKELDQLEEREKTRKNLKADVEQKLVKSVASATVVFIATR